LLHSQSGLPDLASSIVSLKQRDGGFAIGGEHRTSAAACVASWATAGPLIVELLPDAASVFLPPLPDPDGILIDTPPYSG